MKTALALLTIHLILSSCNNFTPREIHIRQMCDCMDSATTEYNTSAYKILLGSTLDSSINELSAFGCAQSIIKSNNLPLKEVPLVYQDFKKSDCAKKFGIK